MATGRPPKLTDEIREQIATFIEVGVPAEVAARASGISPRTYYAWKSRADRGGKNDAPYRRFVERIEQAQATAEANLVASIQRSADRGSWQAAAWLLERGLSADRWTKKEGKPNGSDRHSDEAEGEVETEDARSPAEAIRDELAERRKRAR